MQSLKKILHNYWLFNILLSFFCFVVYPQNEVTQKELQLGFNYGAGTSKSAPFNGNYDYNSNFYKLQFNYPLTNGFNWQLALNIEPSYYRIEYYSESFLSTFSPEQAALIDTKLLINEFAFNLGLQLKYRLHKNIMVYMMGSIGPTTIDRETERLNEGFAFSDILACGLNYRLNNLIFDFRASIRHVSNAGLYYPNKGYNSSGIEIGLSVPLIKTTLIN